MDVKITMLLSKAYELNRQLILCTNMQLIDNNCPCTCTQCVVREMLLSEHFSQDPLELENYFGQVETKT